MKQLTAILIFQLLAFSLMAQDCDCCNLREKGQERYNAGDFKKALDIWKDAKNMPDAAKCADLDKLIAKAKSKLQPKPAAPEPSVDKVARKADDDAWEIAQGSFEGCKRYLDKYPAGLHASEAQKCKDGFSDSDGDGVLNMHDLCPNEKGDAAHNGCLTTTNTRSKPASGMIRVTGGSFSMGDLFNESESDENPHVVNVDDFSISATEITFDEFDAFCEATGREKASDNGWGRGARPAIYVEWYDAVEYCNWRSVQEKLQPCYTIDKTTKDPNNTKSADTKRWIVRCNWGANGYRLPTEAEWEYAARGGGQKVRFGNKKDMIDPAEVNFNPAAVNKKDYSVLGEYRAQTTPCGSLNSPNSLGLHDMSGNLWEWCWDWYDEKYYTQSDGARNPRGASAGQYRCVRGGSWGSHPNHCRAAVRYDRSPHYRDYNLGFRVVRH